MMEYVAVHILHNPLNTTALDTQVHTALMLIPVLHIEVKGLLFIKNNNNNML